MREILMSIQPKWCEKIINGEKTVEVRKTAPKEVPFKVYIYCTKDKRGKIGKPSINYKTVGIWEKTFCPPSFVGFGGKVIGEFICNRIETIPVDSEAFIAISKPACITMDELIDYCSGNDMYGLHISDLKVYDEPKELGEFKGYCNKKEDCYKDIVRHCNDTHFDWKCNSITRPPQSWQYVEEQLFKKVEQFK